MDNMTTKTITITLDAYKRLRAKKTSNESFTDIILKLTRRKNTLDYLRSLKPSAELADNIEKAMRETRKAKLRKVGFQ
ncbi:Putative antitoxin [uncultured archaeon]|nr:Putative antitoxin [uncultured archaeon]